MRNNTNINVVSLNKKGRYYRKMILQMSDEELLKIFPEPSEILLNKIKGKVVKMGQLWSVRN